MYKRYLKNTSKIYFGNGSRCTYCGSLPYSVKWQQFIKSSIDQSWHKKVHFQEGKGFVFLLAIDLFSLLPSSCWIQPSKWGEIDFEEALLSFCSTVFTKASTLMYLLKKVPVYWFSLNRIWIAPKMGYHYWVSIPLYFSIKIS